MLDMGFDNNPNTLKTNYLDMYEGIHADIVYATRFNENLDLSRIYLDKTRMTRETKVKAEEKFLISGQGFTLGKLLDDTDCQILLDTGTSKFYMSSSFYLRCKIVHALPKFVSNTQII